MIVNCRHCRQPHRTRRRGGSHVCRRCREAAAERARADKRSAAKHVCIARSEPPCVDPHREKRIQALAARAAAKLPLFDDRRGTR